MSAKIIQQIGGAGQLDNVMLRDINSKKGDARGKAESSGAFVGNFQASQRPILGVPVSGQSIWIS